jgi:Caspase domain
VTWAIVIGIDDYGREDMRLHAAVADAVRFSEWVTSAEGGNVPSSNLRVLLGRADDPEPKPDDVVPTKDNIVTAINDVVTAAGRADRLYFFFAGHGITARVANRDEGALVTPGFDELHTDHSLALRSLIEHFETTPFKDQFFFVDACRNVPWREREFEIGRWPIPRRRDPGEPPVQQFILHATSPGLTATERGWPGEETGAFTDVLMRGLAGDGRAKAWSWERNCYEVRWERLATYVRDEMERRKHPTKPPPGTPAEGWPIQIPQDAGSRGVANRDRDPLMVAFSSGRFPPLDLTLELKADPAFDEAEVSVLDAIGDPVVSALRLPGTSITFSLAPKTYAARVSTPDQRVGRVKAPIDLYEALTEQIELGPDEAGAGHVSGEVAPDGVAGLEAPPGTIAIRSRDPLGTAEILDEAGQVVAVTTGDEERTLKPGFYRVRYFGPEESADEQFVVLSAGEVETVELQAPSAPTTAVAALVEAMGGSIAGGTVIAVAGAEPLAWPQPSTIVLAGLGAALQGEGGLERIGPKLPSDVGEQGSGVALYAVAGDQNTALLEGLRTRIWAAGDPVPAEATVPQLSESGVTSYVTAVDEATTHWVSLERDGVAPTVAVLPLLPGRLAVFVVQVEPEQVRGHQVHPVAGPGPSSTPDRLRRMETLQRLLLSGRLDGAPVLARELAAGAHEDPFAGCLAGYVLLRLGFHDELGDLTNEIVEVAPKLSDAYILRGEHEAAAGRSETAAQAFADAVNAGIPAFGEGLTRLVEGLRATAFNHPRGSLVRHIFQRHARGSMWSAFTPRRELTPGQLVITGADIGYEG